MGRGKLRKRMGGWLSYVWWGGDPDAPDQLSGLSRRDIHLVRRSWAPLYKNQVENGQEIFKRLFRSYPHIKEHFRAIKNLSESEIHSSFQFKAHVINLMTAFNTIISTLDQPEVAAAMLVKVGESHNKRKIPKVHFEELKVTLVTLFTELGFDQDTLTAWSRTITFFYSNIYSQLTHEHQHLS